MKKSVKNSLAGVHMTDKLIDFWQAMHSKGLAMVEPECIYAS